MSGLTGAAVGLAGLGLKGMTKRWDLESRAWTFTLPPRQVPFVTIFIRCHVEPHIREAPGKPIHLCFSQFRGFPQISGFCLRNAAHVFNLASLKPSVSE